MFVDTDILYLLPEIVLLLGLLWLLIFGTFRGADAEPTTSRLVMVLLAIVTILIVTGGPGATRVFSDLLILDSYGRFMKTLVLLGGIMTLAISTGYRKAQGLMQHEYPVLIGFATLGMLLMISANDLMSLYLAIELQSLSLYILAAFDRNSGRSTEAGLKYFVLGALSSGLLLYGCSFIYGSVGSTSFEVITQTIKIGETPSSAFVVGLVLLCCGLAFKISAVPFHMWTPDVYEGSPTSVTAFFSVAPKIAALSLLMRLLVDAFPGATPQWQQVIVLLSIASMVLGSAIAVFQTNIKRLMAYSAIAHVGYALMGIATGVESGFQSVIIYLVIYLVLVVGIFGCILCMKSNENMLENIEDLAGIGATKPLLAIALTVLLLGLAGIPPMAGFFAKFYVFMSALQSGLYWLVLVGALSTVVGAFYYLRIIKFMYFDSPKYEFDKTFGREVNFVIALCTLFALFFFVNPSPIVLRAAHAAASLFS